MAMRDKGSNIGVSTQMSSFMTVERVLKEIVDKLMWHRPLQKLLFYSDKHCLALNDLTQDQVFSLLDNQIKIVPKL